MKRSYYKRQGRIAFEAGEQWENACPYTNEIDAEKRNLFHQGWLSAFADAADSALAEFVEKEGTLWIGDGDSPWTEEAKRLMAFSH